MKATKFTTKEEWTKFLLSYVKEMDQRERLVIKFPFGMDVTRIEIYCGESLTEIGSPIGEMVSGPALNGPVSIAVFSDYTNKPKSKSSYTYFNDCARHIEKISSGIVTILEEKKAS